MRRSREQRISDADVSVPRLRKQTLPKGYKSRQRMHRQQRCWAEGQFVGERNSQTTSTTRRAEMSEREMLELAARAAGIDAEFHPDTAYDTEGMWLKGTRTPDNSKYWNPLVSDGDALRLAVKLELHIFGSRIGCNVNDEIFIDAVDFGNDPYAATRRAIVRAAADIGRGMATPAPLRSE